MKERSGHLHVLDFIPDVTLFGRLFQWWNYILTLVEKSFKALIVTEMCKKNIEVSIE